MSLIRIFDTIDSVASDIDSKIRKGPAASYIHSIPCLNIFTTINRYRKSLHDLSYEKYQSLSEINDVNERETLLAALEVRLRVLPSLSISRRIHDNLLFSGQLCRDLSLNGDYYQATDVERWVELLSNPRWHCYRTNTLKETAHSRLDRYISSLRSLWAKLPAIGLSPDDNGWIVSLFVHELWFSGELAKFDFLINLQRADAESIFRQDCLGRTSLHFMIEKCYPDLDGSVDDELSANPTPYLDQLDVTDAFGRTALHIACSVPKKGLGSEQLGIIRILLENNANTDIRDEYGCLAFEYAMFNNREDILRLFHKIRGIDIREALATMAQVREGKRKVIRDMNTARSRLKAQRRAQTALEINDGVLK